MASNLSRIAVSMILSLTLSACSGSGGGAAAPIPLPTIGPTVMSVPLSSTGGYSGTIAFAAGSAQGIVPTAALSTTVPTTSPATPAMGTFAPVLTYIQLSASAATTFSQTPTLTLSVPNSVITAGQIFHVAAYDPASFSWITFSGIATASSQTLSFPPILSTFTASSTPLVLVVYNA